VDIQYSISDLERLSGVKAHTLRVWESRYKLIVPSRTDTNIRYYSDEDLKKIMNVAFLVHNGLRISKVASMTDTEQRSLVLDKSNGGHNHEGTLTALKVAMIEFDQETFERVLNRCMLNLGAEEAFNSVLGDFLRHLGVLWQTNAITVAHEHFVTSMIKQKLYSLIDQLTVAPSPQAKSHLLYLPAGELHELGLLYLHFLLKKNGQRSLFLGQDVPLEFLGEANDHLNADVIISIFTTHPQKEDVENYIHQLGTTNGSRKTKFLLAGYPLREYTKPLKDKRFKLYGTLEDLRQLIVETYQYSRQEIKAS
jgi:DNA-binding transcriptional MerR regulator